MSVVGRLTGSVAGLAGILLLAACAQEPAPLTLPPPKAAAASFTAVDTDADDHIGETEWVAHGDRTFGTLDADQSGDVSAEEMSAGFDAFDLDGDGVLSSHEVDAAAFDLDEDGVLSREEWEIANAHARIDANGDGRVDRDELRSRRANNFKSYDRDLDRRVSQVELSSDAPGFTLFRF